ncbi:hypothetical protein OTU49_010381 [Cherax quadricarinatus]|uniref:Uncharacterized protein n=1 Tax=Cherax quadricarinatus TaxID=27406 RepID=A0AAW0YIZ8_CHEQU
MSPNRKRSVGKSVQKRITRRQISFATKIAILDKLKAGVRPCIIEQEFGVKYNSILSIKFNETKIRAKGSTKGNPVNQETYCMSSSDRHLRVYEHVNTSVHRNRYKEYLEARKSGFDKIAELELMEARKDCEDRIKELENLLAKRALKGKKSAVLLQEYSNKNEIMDFQRRGAVIKSTSKVDGQGSESHPDKTIRQEFSLGVGEKQELINNGLGSNRKSLEENSMPSTSGLQGRCKKRCPKCSAIVPSRKYACECGHNFFAEKEHLKKKREAQLQKAGIIASENGNLWRAFDAIQKQSAKIRGGGYTVATLYFKECPTRNIKGIISGSALEEADKALLMNIFCKVAKSLKRKEREHEKESAFQDNPGEKCLVVLNECKVSKSGWCG